MNDKIKINNKNQENLILFLDVAILIGILFFLVASIIELFYGITIVKLLFFIGSLILFLVYSIQLYLAWRHKFIIFSFGGSISGNRNKSNFLNPLGEMFVN